MPPPSPLLITSFRWCSADDWYTFETMMLQAPRVVRIEWPNIPAEFDSEWRRMLVVNCKTLRRFEVSGGALDVRALWKESQRQHWPHLQTLRIGASADAQTLDGAVELLRRLPRMEHLLVAPADWDDILCP